MTRTKLRRIIANAIRANPEQDAREAADQAVRATGLRRALWASYSVEVRASIIRGAMRDVKKEQ